MKILFLDDDERRLDTARRIYQREHDLHMVTTAKAAIEALQKETFDTVMLDHDLEGEFFVESSRKDCGMEVVRWMVENRPVVGNVIVHSWNQRAGMEMTDLLKEAGFNVEYTPFTYIESDTSF